MANIYKELESDLESFRKVKIKIKLMILKKKNKAIFNLSCCKPGHGDLRAWAERGVLLLNTVLSVRAGSSNSHKNQGWEKFTDTVIRELSARKVSPRVAL